MVSEWVCDRAVGFSLLDVERRAEKSTWFGLVVWNLASRRFRAAAASLRVSNRSRSTLWRRKSAMPDRSRSEYRSGRQTGIPGHLPGAQRAGALEAAQYLVVGRVEVEKARDGRVKQDRRVAVLAAHARELFQSLRSAAASLRLARATLPSHGAPPRRGRRSSRRTSRDPAAADECLVRLGSHLAPLSNVAVNRTKRFRPASTCSFRKMR
jgi:hypothetical protein